MSARRRNFNNEDDELTEPLSLDEMDTQLPGSEPGYSRGGDDETEFAFGSSGRIDETGFAGGQPIESRRTVEAILWVKEGDRRGHYFPIHHRTVIGRDEGNVILDDHRVSGQHAKITIENGKYFIWDLASANGTYVKGRRIREATPLEENDRIKIGDTVFVVKFLDERKKPAKRTSVKRKTTASKAKSKSATSGTRRKASPKKK